MPISQAFEQLRVLCFVYKSFTSNLTAIEIQKTKRTLKKQQTNFTKMATFRLPKLRLEFKYANKFTHN